MNCGGDKAKTDVETILSRMGWENIGLRQGRSTNTVKAYFHTLLSVLKGVSKLSKGDVLLLQYPLKKYYDFIVRKANKKGVKVVTLIHDLGSFRRKRLTVDEEIERLNRSSLLMVHTSEMSFWLRQHGVSVPIVEIGLWDYLSESESNKEGPSASPGLHIVYAGDLSLRANEWLYKLAELEKNIELLVYGEGFDESRKRTNIKWEGFADSDSIVAACKGDYGIVWYEDSLDDITGPIGEYLPYCASHKASLYLRAGLPVIIWEKAALAKILIELGVGIAVPALSNLRERLMAVTEEEYATMRKKARLVGEKIKKGGFLSDAVKKI